MHTLYPNMRKSDRSSQRSRRQTRETVSISSPMWFIDDVTKSNVQKSKELNKLNNLALIQLITTEN